jgi:hypothetical protein
MNSPINTICRLGKLLLPLLVLFTCIRAVAEQSSFTASVSDNSVAVGNQIQVTFTLEGTSSARNFQGPSFSGFSVLMGPSQSSSTSIVNGSISQSISLTYVIQADKEGTFSIGSASIESGGKKLTSNPITITVTKGSPPAGGQGKQGGQGSDQMVAGGKSVFLRANVNKTNVYLGEAIVVTYKLYTKVTLVNYAISKIPSFNGFWSQDIQLPQQLEFHGENYEGVNYKVADVKKMILFPQRSGTLTLEPMEGEVIARVQVKRQRSNDPFDQFFNDPFFNNPFFNNSVQDVKVSMKSDPVKITVRDLPANAPSSFTGAVGKFTMEASLDKNEVKAHDGVTLKIKITGKGNLKLIDPPKISFPAEFDTYDPKINSNINTTTAGVTGSKTFEYLVIPRNAGEYKIPVSDFSFFDLERKQYSEIPGSNFVLKVGKGEEIAATAITGVSKSDVQFIGKDIRFIKTGPLNIIQSNRLLYNTPVFYGFMAAPVLLFIFLVAWRRRKEEQAGNVSLMKSRAANKVARKRLSAAKKFLDQQKREQFLDEMFRAQWGFVSDKLQIPVSELSKENVAIALAARKVSHDSIKEFIQTLDSCELARFAPGAAASIEEIYKSGIHVISKLEEEIR